MTLARCPRCGTEFVLEGKDFCPNEDCRYAVALMDHPQRDTGPARLERRPGDEALPPPVPPIGVPAPSPPPAPSSSSSPPSSPQPSLWRRRPGLILVAVVLVLIALVAVPLLT